MIKGGNSFSPTQVKNKRGDLAKFIAAQKMSARGNARTPFQWDSTLNAGFTTGIPWIKINNNYKTVNSLSQENDPNSVLNYFRKMVKLRNDHPVLVYGKYTLLDKDNPDVYAYTRELNGKKILILLNFKSKVATVKTGINLSKATLLSGNYSATSKGETLQPYEAVLYELYPPFTGK